MKKIITVLAVLSLLLAFAACGKNEQADAPDGKETVTDTADGGFAGVININTKEAWQEKFPDKEIGEFYVHYAEYETGEYEEIYFFAKDQSIEEWVNSPFNLSGWFEADGMIVSENGSYVLKPESNGFSDGSTLEAVKLDTPIQNPDAVN